MITGLDLEYTNFSQVPAGNENAKSHFRVKRPISPGMQLASTVGVQIITSIASIVIINIKLFDT